MDLHGIVEKFGQLSSAGDRTAEEILGYDEDGLLVSGEVAVLESEVHAAASSKKTILRTRPDRALLLTVDVP